MTHVMVNPNLRASTFGLNWTQKASSS